jgi:isohexenylglutaconyl-CoA hydratase
MTTDIRNEAEALVVSMQYATELIALAVAQTGPVLHVTLNRPDARNAMSLKMVAELRQVLQDAEGTAGKPGAVRVVVLRGAGGHFCAGADLKDMAGARMRAMQAQGSGLQDPIAEVNAEFGQLCVAYSRSPLAVVAVLEGTVMGGGFGLACVADVAIASDTANFWSSVWATRRPNVWRSLVVGWTPQPRCAWGWFMKPLQVTPSTAL